MPQKSLEYLKNELDKIQKLTSRKEQMLKENGKSMLDGGKSMSQQVEMVIFSHFLTIFAHIKPHFSPNLATYGSFGRI